LSELQAEVLKLRRELGSVEDPALALADQRFEEGPERRRVSDLLDQLKPTTEPMRHVWFELDAAINALVCAVEDWVLDRMVIGLWSGDRVDHWRATRPTPLDPIEHSFELERREAEYMKEHGLTAGGEVTAS
jgi:hypothetical protein